MGIQYLPSNIHKKVFGMPAPKLKTEVDPEDFMTRLSIRHLQNNGLYGKKTTTYPQVDLDLPDLVGGSLAEHFYKIGTDGSEPYLSKAKAFAKADIPEMPKMSDWIHKSGWTKYASKKKPEAVEYPDEENALVFDVEVLYKVHDFAVLAVAASADAWYCWLSPWLLGESENPRQLIPLGSKEEKLIIGHNISYDRKRTKEEYSINLTNNMFIDTMSLHIAVNGMCSRQRMNWMKVKRVKNQLDSGVFESELRESGIEDSKLEDSILELQAELEDNPWVNVSTLNNLADVGFLHCGIEHDKSARDWFGTLTREEVVEKLNMLVDYCARDVDVTFKVYKVLLPRFIDVVPHPVSFAALRHMSSLFLPIDQAWEKYLEDTEACYNAANEELCKSLVELVEEAVDLKDTPEKWQADPWLAQLDWTITPIKMVKPKKKGEEPRPAKRQKLPGYPKWYKDLFPSMNSPINISVRSRTAIILLRLKWDDYPIIWSDVHGFVFRTPATQKQRCLDKNYPFADMNTEKNMALKDDPSVVYFKVPHKDGPKARCVSPMASAYREYFDKGILSSEFELAAKAIKVNAACSYWTSSRERVRSQMTVWSSDTDMGVPVKSGKDFGMILPGLIPMGTVTRRAVEKTWLTASNAKKNRIGSEQKSMVRSPPGYKFVGADVDSEELWIASLVGDSMFKMHGGTALGWMTLEGSKNEGTDLHSKTASILGISRNDAKIFNYGRIYGAGLAFATQLLKQFNPTLTDKEVQDTAGRLYAATKGIKSKSRALGINNFWRNGSESLIFNRLEEMADQNAPRTPVLGAAITEALQRSNLKASPFLPSRINWSIQSSGVDYLHLLITSMAYLIKKYDIDARLFITVHDEIRYMTKDEDVNRTALALQISNMWTRAMFSSQLGIQELPYGVAFFSLIDIDHVLRKEVDLDCVTMSHPTPIPPGYSMDVYQLADKCRSLAKVDPVTGELLKPREIDFSGIEYMPEFSVTEEIEETRGSMVPYVAAQIAATPAEVTQIERLVRDPNTDWRDYFDEPSQTKTGEEQDEVLDIDAIMKEEAEKKSNLEPESDTKPTKPKKRTSSKPKKAKPAATSQKKGSKSKKSKTNAAKEKEQQPAIETLAEETEPEALAAAQSRAGNAAPQPVKEKRRYTRRTTANLHPVFVLPPSLASLTAPDTQEGRARMEWWRENRAKENGDTPYSNYQRHRNKGFWTGNSSDVQSPHQSGYNPEDFFSPEEMLSVFQHDSKHIDLGHDDYS